MRESQLRTETHARPVNLSLCESTKLVHRMLLIPKEMACFSDNDSSLGKEHVDKRTT